MGAGLLWHDTEGKQGAELKLETRVVGFSLRAGAAINLMLEKQLHSGDTWSGLFPAAN